jgi:hypothetical protein
MSPIVRVQPRTKVLVNQSNLINRKLVDLTDVDFTNLGDGAILVYDQDSETFVVTNALNKQRIDCGTF